MHQSGLLAAHPATLTLERHPAEVERGRRHVADACRDYEGDIACTAMLLASELLTNALEHGAGEITLKVTAQTAAVRVEVADESPAHPALQRPRPAWTAEMGRGLLIVDHLADSWGVMSISPGAGKTVWFILLA